MTAPGRPPLRVCGLTAVQWATAQDDTSKAGLHRARQSLAGRRIVPADELARVADSTGVDLAELTRALAALRGYLAPDAPAGDPDGPGLADGDWDVPGASAVAAGHRATSAPTTTPSASPTPPATHGHPPHED